jgi:lysophospholipase L1-like esterase
LRSLLNIAALIAALSGAACSSGSPNPIQPPPPAPALQLTCPARQVRDASSPQGTDVHFDAPAPAGGRPPYQVNCDPGSSSIFPIGETVVNCNVTDADMAQASCTFTVGVRVSQVLARTKYVAFGDSITVGAVSLVPLVTLATVDTYPAKLEDLLRRRYPTQEIVVLNRGLGGEQTNRGATRLPGVLDADRPEVVLILEGVNASWRLTVDQQANAIRSMILASQQRGVEVILATVMAVSEEWEADGHAGAIARIKELNTRIKQMAMEFKLGQVVDLYAIFDANRQLLGEDGLHPTAEGQTRIAEAFSEEIVRRYHIASGDPTGEPSAFSFAIRGRAR